MGSEGTLRLDSCDPVAYDNRLALYSSIDSAQQSRHTVRGGDETAATSTSDGRSVVGYYPAQDPEAGYRETSHQLFTKAPYKYECNILLHVGPRSPLRRVRMSRESRHEPRIWFV